jgi:hypothetical protein
MWNIKSCMAVLSIVRDGLNHESLEYAEEQPTPSALIIMRKNKAENPSSVRFESPSHKGSGILVTYGSNCNWIESHFLLVLVYLNAVDNDFCNLAILNVEVGVDPDQVTL